MTMVALVSMLLWNIWSKEVMENPWWLIAVGTILIFIALYLLGTSGPKDVRERAKSLEDRYDINLPWWLAIWRRLGAGLRIELLGRIKEENVAQMSVLTTESEIQRVELESGFAVDRTEEARKVEIATHSNVLAITDEATKRKVSPLMLDQIRGKEEESKIKIEEHQELARIDLEKRWKEIEQDLKAGFVYAQKEYQYLQLFKQYLFGLYEERKLIEGSESLAKDDQLRLLNTHIRAMERDFREQQKRLLQTPTRKELRTSDEDTDSE